MRSVALLVDEIKSQLLRTHFFLSNRFQASGAVSVLCRKYPLERRRLGHWFDCLNSAGFPRGSKSHHVGTGRLRQEADAAQQVLEARTGTQSVGASSCLSAPYRPCPAIGRPIRRHLQSEFSNSLCHPTQSGISID